MKNSFALAAAALLAAGAQGQSTISSGKGFGTYYYDMEQVDACGTSFKYQNMGVVRCSPQAGLTLDKINSNNIVAMNNTELGSDMDKYCGKKVVVTVNGKKSDMPLFIGDGCERCATGSSDSDSWNAQGAPGLDFSYSVFNELDGGKGCDDGHMEISWEILDESIFDFSGSGGSQSSPSASASASPSSSSSASSQPIVSATARAVAGAYAAVKNAAPSPSTTLVQSASSSASSASASVSPSASSESCSFGSWKCNGNVIERCLQTGMAPIATCASGLTCHGDTSPYCAPATQSATATPAF